MPSSLFKLLKPHLALHISMQRKVNNRNTMLYSNWKRPYRNNTQKEKESYLVRYESARNLTHQWAPNPTYTFSFCISPKALRKAERPAASQPLQPLKARLFWGEERRGVTCYVTKNFFVPSHVLVIRKYEALALCLLRHRLKGCH